MKLLGAVLNSGALSRGSGSNLLGSLLGSVMGGGGAATSGMAPGGGGLGGLLGSLMGGSGGGLAAAASQGGLGNLLGGLLGGGSSGGGGLGQLLGAAMSQFGGASGGAMNNFQSDINREEANQQALILVRAMIDAAKADGQVDEQEQQKILQGFGTDITEEETAFLLKEMSRPVDINDLVSQVPDGMEHQVYLMSLTAIDLDTNPEAEYLHQLAQGLGLDADTVNAIHDQVGASRLYN